MVENIFARRKGLQSQLISFLEERGV